MAAGLQQATDDTSILVVVVDVNPFFWSSLSHESRHAGCLADFVEQVCFGSSLPSCFQALCHEATSC